MKRMANGKTVLGTVVSIVLTLSLLAILGWVYRSNFLTTSLETTIARQGKIEHNLKVTGVFANEEALIHAPTAGKPEYLGKEKQRFRKGDAVALLKPEGVSVGSNQGQATIAVLAPSGGVLCYITDGLEGLITPENLLSMDLSRVLNQSGEARKVEHTVQSGSVIGKMVNNLRPTVAVVKIPPTDEIKIGKILKFKIQQLVYQAKVVRVVKDPPSIVVQFMEHIEGTEKERLQEISWIERSSTEGVVVPKSCLWTKGEEQGLFVVQEGIIHFRKIVIADENENFICVLEKYLPQGISVINNPLTNIEGVAIKVKSSS